MHGRERCCSPTADRALVPPPGRLFVAAGVASRAAVQCPCRSVLFGPSIDALRRLGAAGQRLDEPVRVVDRYMIVHFSQMPGRSAIDLVGNYHASRVVPMLLVSIAAMLGAMITPHLSHDWEAGRREQVAARLRLFIKLFGFALFAAAVAVLAAAPLLFGVALRGKFPGGQAVLPWTLVYCTWFGLSLILQDYLLCAEKARLASVSLACGLALNVRLNLVLLPRLGLEGAVLATAAANALSLVLVCLFNRRLGFRLDDGAKLAFVLPMLVCLGVWVSLIALALVAI